MLDELRERITAYLSQNQVCVISTSGSQGAWSITAQYQNRGLEIMCRVPRWSDALYHLEQDPHALVTILDSTPNSVRWLQYRGFAHIEPSSTDNRYISVYIEPDRVDLIDESRGWGARETLEMGSSDTDQIKPKEN